MKKLFVVVLTVLMVLGLAGCAKKEEKQEEKKEETVEKVVIGLSGPLTGGAAVYGLAVKNAAELAVAEVNALGGLQFELYMEDDQCEGEKAVNAFGVLQDKGLQISMCTVTSGAGTAVAPLLKDENIFAITPSGSAPSVTLANINDETSYYGNVFQMCFNDPNQGTASAVYIKDHNLGSKVGIIFKSDDTYSTGITQKFEAKANEIGLAYVECGTFDDSTSTDFSTQVKKAADEGCDVVFLPIYYGPASLILTEANKIGYQTKFFGVDGMDGILSQAGFDTKLAEGVFLLTPFDASATDNKTVNFVKNYTEKYGKETLNQFGADAYDCIYAIYEACKNGNVNGNMSASEICDILVAQFTSMTFNGLTGDCIWRVDGTVDKTPKAVIIENGAYVAAE